MPFPPNRLPAPSRRKRRKASNVMFAIVGVTAVGLLLVYWFGVFSGPADTTPEVKGEDLGITETVVKDEQPVLEFEEPPVAEETLIPAPAPEADELPPSERETEEEVDVTPIPADEEVSTAETPRGLELAANTATRGATGNTENQEVADTGNPQIATARALIERGELITARQRLNRLLRTGDLSSVATQEVRGLLTKLANETIFSDKRFSGDPLIEYYTVKRGDAYAKIAKNYAVPYQVIMEINGGDELIRIGQVLKIPRGPFNAVVDTSDFRMDVYLQDTFVRSYRVGLGKDPGTPVGAWKVTTRLPNPTYYPPPSAPDKQELPGGHPDNPLGRRWIGLEGVSGEAAERGTDHYGIHGTIEPESIGRAVSLGCIRMHNEDVRFVYNVLQPGKSKVVTQP